MQAGHPSFERPFIHEIEDTSGVRNLNAVIYDGILLMGWLSIQPIR